MNIKRFYAPTAREALAKARMVFGDGTLILSNRQTPDGVEVMATAEETLQDMDAGMQTSSPLQTALERRSAANIPGEEQLAQPNRLLGQHIGEHGDAALAAHGEDGHDLIVVAGIDVQMSLCLVK